MGAGCCSPNNTNNPNQTGSSKQLFPPKLDAHLDWNVRIEALNDRGTSLFSQLFDDFKCLDVQICSSFEAWTESPIYFKKLNSIIFSSPSNGNLYSFDLKSKNTSILLENAGIFGGIYNDDEIPFDELKESGPNGICIGLDDKIIMNQLALRRIIAFDPINIDKNNIIIISDQYENKKLNSPNDVTLSPDGKCIYFTDPPYGLQKKEDNGFQESFNRSKLGFQGIYRMDLENINNKRREPKLIINDMIGPNGLVITNDKKYLIVSNTTNKNDLDPYWNVYKINNNNNDELYELIKRIDFKMMEDSSKNYSAMDGLEIYNDEILFAVGPNGICLIDLINFEMVGRINIDHKISNIHIHNGYIYVTSQDHLFRIKLK